MFVYLKLWEHLYRAFIAPHFNYCAESWHFCSKCLTEKLEKLKERALRFVYQDKTSAFETLVVKNGHSTLANQSLAIMLSVSHVNEVCMYVFMYVYLRDK